MYIELHTSSAFSFLDGASLPEALIDRAASLGYPALALLDRDGVYGAPRFHLAAKRAGIKAIIGAELTISSGLARPFEPPAFALRATAGKPDEPDVRLGCASLRASESVGPRTARRRTRERFRSPSSSNRRPATAISVASSPR